MSNVLRLRGKGIHTLIGVGLVAAAVSPASADIVTDWNSTIRQVIQHDGTNPVNQANPGWSTRSIAMLNGAIYDTFQTLHRDHAPFLVDTTAPVDTSLKAAVNQAAYNVLKNCYPGEAAILNGALNTAYNNRMALIPAGPSKDQGVALGDFIAQQYIAARSNDNSSNSVPYMPSPDPGKWRPDPYHPGQQAWGPEWGAVTPWAIPNTASFVGALPPPPALDSQAYTDAYNQVKDYGDLNSVVRSPTETQIGLFWGYDHAGLGPPPVLFVRNLEEIGAQAGNSPNENARMFAMASVAMADAATAAWDAKFQYNFWRPVTGILEGDTDGNPNTAVDPQWRPLGAPGNDPNSSTDDFTPPFPSWTSGHATMGGALFQSIESFFGTNNFDAIDGILGNDPLYTLTSEEPNSGGARDYSSFTQVAPLAPGAEDSPEGENGMSRIYLGIHWIFDQTAGITLGNDIANYVADNHFQRVPEPSTWALGLLGLAALGLVARRRTR